MEKERKFSIQNTSSFTGFLITTPGRDFNHPGKLCYSQRWGSTETKGHEVAKQQQTSSQAYRNQRKAWSHHRHGYSLNFLYLEVLLSGYRRKMLEDGSKNIQYKYSNVYSIPCWFRIVSNSEFSFTFSKKLHQSRRNRQNTKTIIRQRKTLKAVQWAFLGPEFPRGSSTGKTRFSRNSAYHWHHAQPL